MSQNTQNDFTPASSTPGLKPALAAALASLEVQLDQELTKYRRIRNTGKKHNYLNIQSFTASNNKTFNQSTTNIDTIIPNTGLIEDKSISLPLIPVTAPSLTISNIISNSENVTTDEKPPNQEIYTNGTDTEEMINSIVHSKPTTTETEEITSTTDTVNHPDEYLESSEALLRSLNDELTPEIKPQSYSESVLSPTGIASMFLLLLASLILGYVVLNPKYLPKLNFNLSNNNSFSSISTSKNAKPGDRIITSTTVPEITPIAKYPNLASQEFTQVRDPNDVVGLKPKVNPTPVIPQITPTTLTIQPPLTSIAPLPKLSPFIADVPNITNSSSSRVSQISPSPSISTSSTPETKISLAPLPEDIKPGANGYYYIITDNDSKDSLAAAKKIVADAYLSPNGKYIYLGALKTKDDVKRRLQELANQGVAGRVQN
ncbi:hypothetical protein H6F32_19935 [Anabaena sp. FACHB-1237]|uniref:hypothetical protein n=1 Tax=Anabaena sp. FACHB-1237 TaxID=2692769 RepID=UPI001681C06D|nr:hypothetical protein [Anabaena sp. FACHB-1237]MBD2139761.1 hypothetical protein [Anabaena sp. FACHB-1237]